MYRNNTRPLASAMPLAALLLVTLSSCSDESPNESWATGGTTQMIGSGGDSATGGAASGGHTFASGGSATGGSDFFGTGGALDGSGGVGSDGSATGGMGTGGAGEVGFRPCPEAGSCKVLPLGDSITFGLQTMVANPTPGGYRVELFRLAHSEGHDITFTGTQQQNGPDTVDAVPFPKKHAGISGQTISQIAGRIPSPDLSEMAHVILLHAGTNDMLADAGAAPGELEKLLDKLITEAPDALIVVSNLIPLPFSPQAITTFNTQVKPMVDERAAQGSHIIFVDQFADFPTNELCDTVHPNDAGYARMGKKWYDAIKSYL